MRVFLLVGIVFLYNMASGALVDKSESLWAVSNSANQFSAEFIKSIAKYKPGNFICSPLSVNVVLAMLRYGTNGQTLQKLSNNLHMPTNDAVVRFGYQSLIDELNNVKNVELRMANKVFTSAKLDLKQVFLNTVSDVFRSEVQKINFVQSTQAAAIINNWVEDKTNSRIKNLVKPDDLNDSTATVLVNAIYFKGKWAKPFNPESTRNRPFNVDEITVRQVPTMYKRGIFKIGQVENLNAQFIELPYHGNEFSLVIILPNSINGLAQVQQNLNKVNVAEMLKSGYESEVYVYLPKFKIETEIDLKSVLEDLGMGEIFENTANFNRLSDIPSKVSKAVQKAFIEVNEEGSEAAAASATMVITMSSMDYVRKEFSVNRPFYYAILHHPTSANLLTGSIKLPTI